MARTVGPLMSLDASGSVANTIVYSKWKGRNYVRQLVIPSNPKSPLQTSTRAMMRQLSRAWALDLGDPERATWEPPAASQAISPFNAFIQSNLRRWTQFESPLQTYLGAAAPSLPTWTALPSVAGGVRQVSIAWDVNAINDGWGLLIFRDPVTGFTPARDNLVLASSIDAAPGTATDTPVLPGTWFYNFIAFDYFGNMSAALGEDSAVVT